MSYKDREREDISGEGINGGSFCKLVPPAIGTVNTAACPDLLPGVSQAGSGFFVCKGESRKDSIVGIEIVVVEEEIKGEGERGEGGRGGGEGEEKKET